MNKRFCKKYIALFLSLIMCFSSFVNVMAASNDSFDKLADVVIGFELMKKIGVIDEAAEFDSVLTKADLARIAAVLNSGNNVANSSIKITDVNTATKNSKYIFNAVSGKIMSLDEGGYFYPNKQVNATELEQAILMSMGYNKIAEKNDLSTISKQLGIMNGIVVEDSSAVRLSEALRAVYNVLEEKVLIPESYGSDGKYETSEETLLELNFGIHYVDGACMPSFVNDGADNYVTIGTVRIECENSIEYMASTGYNVRAYYKEKSATEKELICIDSKALDNEVYVIYAQDIVNVTEGAITFYNANGREYSLSVAGATALYNNNVTTLKKEDGSFTADVQYGVVEVINPSTGYCVVSVKQYENFVVGGNYNGELSEKNVKGYTLDLNAYSKVLITLDGETIGINDIKKDDVLTVMLVDEAGLLTVYVSRNTIQGTISSTDDDRVHIGKRSYTVSEYAKKYYSIKLGTNGVFYLNHLGEIAMLTEQSAWKYAYFMGELGDYWDSEGDVCIKYLDESGVVNVTPLAEKVKVNGVSVESEDFDKTNELSTALKREYTSVAADGKNITAKQRNDWVCQIIKYRTNAYGKVNFINTVSNPGVYYGGDASKLSMYEANKDTWFAGYGSFESFYGDCVIDDETVVFYVPYNYDNEFDASGNAVNSRGSVEEALYTVGQPKQDDFYLYTYDVDDVGYARCIVFDNPTVTQAASFDATQDGIKKAIVKRFYKKAIDDYTEAYAIDCYENGKEVSYTFIDDYQFYLDNSNNPIMPAVGDVIAFEVNSLNKISNMVVRVDYSEKKVGLKPRFAGDATAEKYVLAGLSWSKFGDDFGKVLAVNDHGIKINGTYGINTNSSGLTTTYRFGDKATSTKQYYFNVREKSLVTANPSVISPNSSYAYVVMSYGKATEVYIWIE